MVAVMAFRARAGIISDAKAFAFGAAAKVHSVPASEFFELSPNDLNGQPFPFTQLKDKVTLITNVACQCGFTDKNYKQLVSLHDRMGSRPFEILAFPCNQFGAQEPGTPEDIRGFVEGYKVRFPMMEKIEVNGPGTHPVYTLLKGPEGADIRWNFFTKFLVQCKGEVCTIRRYDGAPEPMKLENEVAELLGEPRSDL